MDSYRYALVIEYNGKNYSGSQIQPNGKTIQSTLEDVMKILIKSPIKTIFSGRTDAGVNSKGQVVHFNVPCKLNTKKFLCSLNALLPDDISVPVVNEVDKNFHSQKKAVYRWYRFIIDNNEQRSAWNKEALYIREPLDVAIMKEALFYLIGEHDFSGFKNASTNNPAKICKVHYVNCEENRGIIKIDIVANRFLYNMIRIIVGTLLKIGTKEWPKERILQILETKDRNLAGPTISPHGLFYMLVGYSDIDKIKHNINKEANTDENIFSKAL